MSRTNTGNKHDPWDMAQAASVLCDIYMELARAEALTRALVHERSGRPDRAEFWIGVFFEIPATGCKPQQQ